MCKTRHVEHSVNVLYVLFYFSLKLILPNGYEYSVSILFVLATSTSDPVTHPPCPPPTPPPTHTRAYTVFAPTKAQFGEFSLYDKLKW